MFRRDPNFKNNVKEGEYVCRCFEHVSRAAIPRATLSVPQLACPELASVCLLVSMGSQRCAPAFRAESHRAHLLARLPVTGKMIKDRAAGWLFFSFLL